MSRAAPTLFPLTPKLSEAALELQVRALFTIAGGVVMKCSQGYRPQRGGTRMTPGLADLEILFLGIRTLAKFETKTPEGLQQHAKLIALPLERVAKSTMNDWRRARAQEAYRQRCLATDTPYGMGGIEEARALLLQLHLAELRHGQFTLTPATPTHPRNAPA